MRVLLQVLGEEVAEGVVLLLQGEVGAVGHAYPCVSEDVLTGVLKRSYVYSPENGSSVIFFSPSESKKSSKLNESQFRITDGLFRDEAQLVALVVMSLVRHLGNCPRGVLVMICRTWRGNGKE